MISSPGSTYTCGVVTLWTVEGAPPTTLEGQPPMALWGPAK